MNAKSRHEPRWSHGYGSKLLRITLRTRKYTWLSYRTRLYGYRILNDFLRLYTLTRACVDVCNLTLWSRLCGRTSFFLGNKRLICWAVRQHSLHRRREAMSRNNRSQLPYLPYWQSLLAFILLVALGSTPSWADLGDPCGSYPTVSHVGDMAILPDTEDFVRERRAAIGDKSYLWPEGKVYYTIDKAYSGEQGSLFRIFCVRRSTWTLYIDCLGSFSFSWLRLVQCLLKFTR